MRRSTGVMCGALLGAHVGALLPGSTQAAPVVGAIVLGAIAAYVERGNPWW